MIRCTPLLRAATIVLLAEAVWPVSQAMGQSVLKRLEQEIRQRVAEDRSAAASAAETPSERSPGYLGAVVDDRQDRRRGARVVEVRPDGPADAAGLRKDDLITGAAGVRVRQTEDLADVMAVFPPGSRVAFDVLRDGQAAKIDVVLGHRDSPADTPLPLPETVPLPLPEPLADPVEPSKPTDDVAKPPAQLQDRLPDEPLPPPLVPRRPGPESTVPTPADVTDDREQLLARIAELERRVKQLEQALADALKP